jgi:S1-C subfamily serine protease
MPIQPAMWVADQLIEHGELIRPWISINAVDVNPKLVAYYDLPTEKGVVVTNVIPGSEAEKSGIEVADILVRMDDIEINNVRDLIKVINNHKVGDSVAMEFFRGPGKVKLKTVLEKAPDTQRPPMAK